MSWNSFTPPADDGNLSSTGNEGLRFLDDAAVIDAWIVYEHDYPLAARGQRSPPLDFEGGGRGSLGHRINCGKYHKSIIYGRVLSQAARLPR